MESLAHMAILCLTIWGIANLFSKMPVPCYIPHHQCLRVLISPYPLTPLLLLSVYFCYNHSRAYKVISHCGIYWVIHVTHCALKDSKTNESRVWLPTRMPNTWYLSWVFPFPFQLLLSKLFLLLLLFFVFIHSKIQSLLWLKNMSSASEIFVLSKNGKLYILKWNEK